MHTEIGSLYHLYNQSNHGELLFRNDADYLDFLRLTKTHLSPVCEILAWCLMPNHFHFCIQATEASVQEKLSGKFFIQSFSRGVGDMLSLYSGHRNMLEGRTGARFRPRSKLESISATMNGRYDVTAVEYIHLNPVKAGLTASPEEWRYSSALDYAGLRKGTLCNLTLARELGLLL